MLTKSILLCFFVLPVIVLAQHNAAFSAIEKAYKGDFTISTNIIYKYYPDNKLDHVTDSLTARHIMQGNNYYFKISDYEIVYETGYYVLIDHDQKTISVSKTADENTELNYGILDAFLSKQNASVSPFDAGKDLTGISITYKDNEVQKADLYVDSKTNYIQKCVIKYFNTLNYETKSMVFAKMEIMYSGYKKTEAHIISTEYGLQKFLMLQSDKITVQPRYKNYELINLIN